MGPQGSAYCDAGEIECVALECSSSGLGLHTRRDTLRLPVTPRGRTPNLRFEFLATCPSAILAAGSQRVPLYAPRPGWGEGVTFEARRGREVAHLGPNVRVFQGPLD